MIPSLSQEIQNELEQLAQRYGQPLIRTVDLHANKAFDPLNKPDRYGEVCMVVRRPNGRLLTMIKTFYPAGAYRLLTGGINHGEHVFHALLREVQEETGLKVEVKRFLAIAAYRLANSSEPPNFYTFAFLLDEIGGTLGAIDEGERVEGFREIAPEDLPTVADYLEHVGNIDSAEIAGNWRDWGEFRAVIHRLVWEALKQ
ncbi:MAG TPA: NUDIX hydrolase [Ktedonobacteraceae bacterium]|nr:NUDIX hydrolase [Ktedonobacteraceae bacterium]